MLALLVITGFFVGADTWLQPYADFKRPRCRISRHFCSISLKPRGKPLMPPAISYVPTAKIDDRAQKTYPQYCKMAFKYRAPPGHNPTAMVLQPDAPVHDRRARLKHTILITSVASRGFLGVGLSWASTPRPLNSIRLVPGYCRIMITICGDVHWQ